MSTSLDITQLQPPGVTEELHLQMIADLQGYWDGEGLDPAKVEAVGCSLCQTPAPLNSIFVRERFSYRMCPTCGLIYPSPRPRASYLEEQYVTGRFAASFHDLYLPSAPYRMATIFRERVEEILAPRVPKGRILDVGASTGHFLAVAVAHGYDGYGVEPNPEMARFAATELGLSNIFCGALEDARYPSDSFDAITLWDVLEHVPDPGTLLAEARRVLRPEGWLFAYTENVDSFNLLITREFSEMISPDVHLRHYSARTFRREFEQAGFHVEDVYTKGLDLAHVSKTVRLYPHILPQGLVPLARDQEDAFQHFINQCGRGDNLRLYARKPGT